MALISLTSNIPGISFKPGSATRAGIFAALTYVTAAGMTLVSAVGNSLTPAMARDFDRGDRGPSHADSGCCWALPPASGFPAFWRRRSLPGRCLQIVYGEEYARSAGVFVHAMVLGTMTYLAAPSGLP
jgi:hypothetical protein